MNNYLNDLNRLTYKYGVVARVNPDNTGLMVQRTRFGSSVVGKYLRELTPYGAVEDLLTMNSDVNNIKKILQQNNQSIEILSKYYGVPSENMRDFNKYYAQLLDKKKKRWEESDYWNIFISSVVDLAVLGTADHFLKISSKLKKIHDGIRLKFNRINRIRRREGLLSAIGKEFELKSLIPKNAAARIPQRAAEDDETASLLYDVGEIPVGGGGADRKELKRRSHGRYDKQRRPTTSGGGALNQSKGRLSKSKAWREDQHGCSFPLYKTDTELSERCKERFYNKQFVDYDEAIEWLKEEGWEVVGRGKHIKLLHKDSPVMLEKGKDYTVAFYNDHKTKFVNIQQWCKEQGKRFGP